jgi:hypothetical protein
MVFPRSRHEIAIQRELSADTLYCYVDALTSVTRVAPLLSPECENGTEDNEDDIARHLATPTLLTRRFALGSFRPGTV